MSNTVNTKRKIISVPCKSDDAVYAIHRNVQSVPVHCLLNSNSGSVENVDVYSKYDLLAGIDLIAEAPLQDDTFSALRSFYDLRKDWIMGYFSYDLKNEIELLQSNNPDRLHFPKAHFFQPRYIVQLRKQELSLHYLPEYTEESEAFRVLENLMKAPELPDTIQTFINIRTTPDSATYNEKIKKILEHIQKGDIYEMNFCTEFYAEDCHIDPAKIYRSLNELSPMPFSAVYRAGDHVAICASPERFLAKRGNKIISQPIKGTARRSPDPETDREIARRLARDPKERSENVMIVDLVRNDLSRTAQKASVKVEELFGVYTFRNLHQMISTVSSRIKEEICFTHVIRDSFPMGSMTGAPKVSAMQLIEEYEDTKRGLYSGSIGYIDPEGDFDFNVVIRTILYNSKKACLSFMTGSAITANSDPAKEYGECQLKAESMQRVLRGHYNPDQSSGSGEDSDS